MLNTLRSLRENAQLRFSPALEMEFQRDHSRRTLGMTRIESLIGVLMFAGCGVLDHVMGGEKAHYLLTMRFAVILPLLAVLIVVSFRQGLRQYLSLSLALSGVVICAGLSWMILTAFDEVGSAYFFGIALTNFFIQGLARVQFSTTTKLVAINMLIFNLMMLLSGPTRQPEYLFIANFFVLMAAIIGGASAYRVEKLERNEYLQNRSLSDHNRALRHDSLTDPLTGLPNRRALDEHLGEILRRSKFDTRSFSVALVDLDHFKKINDTHGHDLGDIVLKRTALTLRRCLRNEDIVGRWGGEEFLIILPNTKAPGARLAALKLKQAIAAMQIPFGESMLSVTATFGIAESTTDEPVEQIVRRADAALYEGKSQGRNAVVIDVRMHADIEERRLREA